MSGTRRAAIAVALFVLIALVLWHGDARDWPALLRSSDPRFLVASMATLAPLIFLWTSRTYFVFGAAGHRISFNQLAPIVVLTNSANALLPAAAGEAVRAIAIRRDFGIAMGESLPLILFERALGFLLLSACLVGLSVGSQAGIVWAGLASSLVALVGYGTVRLLAALPTPDAGPGFAHRLASLAHQMGEPWRDRRLVGGVTTLSVVGFAVGAGQLFFATRALGLDASYTDTTLVWAAGIVVGTLSAIPFGLGAAELTTLVVGPSVTGGRTEEWAAAYLVYRATGTAPLLAISSIIAYRRF